MRFCGWSSPWKLGRKLDENQEILMATLADIQAAIAAEKEEEDKIIALLQQMSTDNKQMAIDLAAAIAANDPAAIQGIVDSLNANTTAMDQAIAGVQNPQP